MKAEGTCMVRGFEPWLGHSVVLQLAVGDIRVPLRGKLLTEGTESIRVRIGEGWDVDIFKSMILRVEDDAMACLPA